MLRQIERERAANRNGFAVQGLRNYTALVTRVLARPAVKRVMEWYEDRVRHLTDDMAEVLGKQPRPRGPRLAIVTNGGGPGVLAADYVAQQPSDGSTLLMAHINSHALAPSLQPKMNYSVERDFVPIVLVGVTPNLLIANVDLPAKTVADCFRYRRHVGLEVALAALRGYLGRPVARGGTRRTGSPIDDLIAAARADRISAVLRPYLEALA